MPSIFLLLPPALLVAGAVAALLAPRAERVAAIVAAWSAVLATLVLWAATRGSLELTLGSLGAGIPVALRLDAVALVCSLAILAAGAGAITWRPRRLPAELAALAAAQVAVTSADLALTALAAGAAIACAVGDLGRRRLVELWAGVLLAAWAAVALQWTGGTATYGAAPAAALNAGIAGLWLLAATALAGALPYRSWPQGAYLQGSFVLLAAIPPIGLGLLFRVYVAGDGRLPGRGLDAALAVVGVAVMLAAAWRAQAAADRPGLLSEALPGLGGLGLFAAAGGVALGAFALALIVLSMGLVVLLLPLLGGDRSESGLLAAGLLAGVPPTLVFAARLLALQAVLEGQPAIAITVVPAAVAWLLWLAACARGAGLPARAGARPARWPPRVVAAAALALGAASGLLFTALASPLGAETGLGSVGPHAAAGPAGVEAASGGWPALAVAAVLVAALVLGRVLGRRLAPPKADLPPPVGLPAWSLSLPRLAAPWAGTRLEPALSGSRPLLWAALLGALAVIVSRLPQ